MTTDFIYIRLHGSEQLYASGYSDAELDWWAERIKSWQARREPLEAKRITGDKIPGPKRPDVYVYFDNDAKVHAPFDAMKLAEKLGL